jgi:hypothetical protein
MSFLSRFGFANARSRSAPRPSQPGPGHSQNPTGGSSQSRGRRELLRVILRDTLNRHGIPAGWVEAEILMSTSRTGERGIHWRLVIKHWDPRLLTHAVAFQQALLKRLTMFEPGAAAWLTGLSWQFDFPDDSPCAPMPHPDSWMEPQPDPFDELESVAPPTPVMSDAAPAASARTSTDARAELESIFAVRDPDFQRHEAGAASGDDATQPMFLRTEPAKL